MLMTIRKQRLLHVQLELLTNMVNNLIRDLIPPILLFVFLIAVSCNVLITKADSSQLEERYPIFVIIMAAYTVICAGCGFLLLRVAEKLRHNSVEAIRSIQLETMTQLVSNGLAGSVGGRTVVATGYRFGVRKQLELRFGHFRALGPGQGVIYLQSILEYTVNGIFMVDSSCRMQLLN